MKLLVVAATEAELGPLLKSYGLDGLPGEAQRDGYAIAAHHGRTTILITGVGMIATTYALTRHLRTHKYDLVLQAGVGGSYDRKLPLGAVVAITTEQYGDMGAEDHNDYLDIFAMGLINANIHPHLDGRLETLVMPATIGINLPKVSGLTVNMVSGSQRTIQHRIARYGCQVESMEGAAFHYVCLQEGVPFIQVRAISNYVIPRDRSQWKMKDAIINLNNWLIDYIAAAK